MPIYLYRCENCGVQFERQQKFTDQPLTRCPECNKKTLHKVYTPVGIIFKGSGFYSTDNRSSSGNNSRSTTKVSDTEKKAETATASTSAETTSTTNSESK